MWPCQTIGHAIQTLACDCSLLHGHIPVLTLYGHIGTGACPDALRVLHQVALPGDQRLLQLDGVVIRHDLAGDIHLRPAP